MEQQPAVMACCQGVGPVPERDIMCAELYKAATSGDTRRLCQLLERGMDNGVHGPCRLSEVSAEMNTVVHLAAGLGHADLVAEACRRQRSLLTAENSRADTPLHCAARAGHVGVVSLLVHQLAGAKEALKKKNRLGDTALHEAARNGHEGVADVLMTTEDTLASIDNGSGVSPLYLAIINGSIPLVKSVMRCSSPSLSGREGVTALHAAAFSRRDITYELLKCKSEIAKEAYVSGSTPLHYAASGGDAEIVQMLLNAYSSATYSKDKDGFFPIHVAASVGNVEGIKLILKKCPDSGELLDNKGRNFLHHAAEKDKIKVVQYVLEHGNKQLEKLISQQDFDGNTPLHLAVESGREEIVGELTRDGRNQSSTLNNQGKTPLELAIDKKMHISLSEMQSCVSRRFITSGAAFGVSRLDKVKPKKSDVSKRYDALSDNIMIVATLIATVAFAATSNLPGGYDNSTGKATLHGQPKFYLFIFFDSMAMALSLVSMILIFFRTVGYGNRPRSLVLSISGLWLAMFFMLMAFIVGAISAGAGRGIVFLACLFFYPHVHQKSLFFDPTAAKAFFKSLPRVEPADVRRASRRAKQHFNDLFLLRGVAKLFLFTDCLAVVSIAIIFAWL